MPKKAQPSVEQVHDAAADVARHTVVPPHPPRTETPIYRATHKRLVITEDRPCFICGVRRSDLLDPQRRADPTINPYGATDLETHHWPAERGLATALDRELLAQDYPSVRQYKTLIEWIDSEANMLVVCSACHRTADHAIHRTLYQDFIATKYAVRTPDGERYAFAADDEDVKQVEAADESIVQQLGIEPLE